MYRRAAPPILIGLFLIIAWNASAQGVGSNEACPALVEEALNALGENCGELGRNSACYGYDQVDSTFTISVEDDYFSQPADRAELVTLASVRTAALNLEEEEWGVAVMNVQANVPNTLPGQAVVFVLMGEAEVQNAVAAEEVTPEVAPVTVRVAVSANVRSGAGTNTNIVGGAAAGTTFQADAVNEERNWVRIIYNNRVAWISTQVLEAAAELERLPVAGAPVVTPMQAFYFTTGTGVPLCHEAPDVVTIRSPQNIEVDLTVNGANIRLGSFVSLKQMTDDEFGIIVHEGHVAGEGDVEAEAGETLLGGLDEDGNWTEWREVRESTEEEMMLGETPGQALAGLGIEVEETPVVTTTGGASCRGFRPTSPLPPQGGLAYGTTTFYWDPAPGATHYRVIVYNNSEPRSLTFDVAAPQTFVGAYLTQETIGGGFDFAWEVQALVNGQVVCRSQRITLQRAAAAGPSGPGFAATWYCSTPGSYSVVLSWSGVPGAETVTFFFDLNFMPASAGPFPGPSGTYTYYTAGGYLENGLASTSGGANAPLGASGFNCF